MASLLSALTSRSSSTPSKLDQSLTSLHSLLYNNVLDSSLPNNGRRSCGRSSEGGRSNEGDKGGFNNNLDEKIEGGEQEIGEWVWEDVCRVRVLTSFDLIWRARFENGGHSAHSCWRRAKRTQ